MDDAELAAFLGCPGVSEPSLCSARSAESLHTGLAAELEQKLVISEASGATDEGSSEVSEAIAKKHEKSQEVSEAIEAKKPVKSCEVSEAIEAKKLEKSCEVSKAIEAKKLGKSGEVPGETATQPKPTEVPEALPHKASRTAAKVKEAFVPDASPNPKRNGPKQNDLDAKRARIEALRWGVG